jgi:Uma2 family endonuclease
MATPTPWHQEIKIGLVNALKRLVPTPFRVTSEVEVRLGELTRRNPDVLVVRAAGFSRRVPSLRADQVVLAVEVVSPGSELTDRVAKPSQYAGAGIGFYWRIETDPQIVIHTYRLNDSDYEYTGAFKHGDLVQAPGLDWACVAIDELVDDE